MMRFHCAISDGPSTAEAVEDVIRQTSRAMSGKVDAVFAFFTGHHADGADDLLERLWLELDPQALIGCSAEGVIGGERDRAPARHRDPGRRAPRRAAAPVSRCRPHRLATPAHRRRRAERPHRPGRADPALIIGLGDPFTTPLDQLLETVNRAGPGIPVIGGMASSARQPGNNVLLRNDQAFNEGFVGLSLAGPVAVQTIVSQGCRPIGRPMLITRSHDNVIDQLGGKPAMQALRKPSTTSPSRIAGYWKMGSSSAGRSANIATASSAAISSSAT